MATRFLINGKDVQERRFHDAVSWAEQQWKEDGSAFDVTASGLDMETVPTMSLTAAWLVLRTECDCDQNGHPDIRRHAPDCKVNVNP